jgi:hypothetical protein
MTLSPRSAVVSEGPRNNTAACPTSSYRSSPSLTVSSVLATHSSSPDITLRATHVTCPLSHSSTGQMWSIWTSPSDSTWTQHSIGQPTGWFLSTIRPVRATDDLYLQKHRLLLLWKPWYLILLTDLINVWRRNKHVLWGLKKSLTKINVNTFSCHLLTTDCFAFHLWKKRHIWMAYFLNTFSTERTKDVFGRKATQLRIVEWLWMENVVNRLILGYLTVLLQLQRLYYFERVRTWTWMVGELLSIWKEALITYYTVICSWKIPDSW